MSKSTALKKQLVHELLEEMKKSDGIFQLPWQHNGSLFPINCVTNNRYHGCNIFLLWFISKLKGYKSNEWGSYKQWALRGGQVKKRSESAKILFYQSLTTTVTDNAINSEDSKKGIIRFARWSSVFNRDQVEGLVEKPTPLLTHDVKPDDEVDTFIAQSGAQIKVGGDEACFIPSLDLIKMPKKKYFIDDNERNATELWYSTLFHELIHWTGTKKRLNRDQSHSYDSANYAFEELVAELGSALLCANFGIATHTRMHHAAYLKSWIRLLGYSDAAFFKAAALAEEAFDYLDLLQVKQAKAA